MRVTRALAGLIFLGVAACATPGQVRRVETAVAAANSERARSDSAQRADLARIQINQRRNLDSIMMLFGRLNDEIQRVSRENASHFDELGQRLYQVANLANSTQSTVSRLRNQVELAVTSAPPVGAADTTTRAPGTGAVPQPGVLLEQGKNAVKTSAFMSGRRSLNQLLVTYPSAAEVPEAIYWIGESFATEQADSARVYYSRVYTAYSTSIKAPTALYKLADLERRSGNIPAAPRNWQLIVTKYPDSPEVPSARDRLRGNP